MTKQEMSNDFKLAMEIACTELRNGRVKRSMIYPTISLYLSHQKIEHKLFWCEAEIKKENLVTYVKEVDNPQFTLKTIEKMKEMLHELEKFELNNNLNASLENNIYKTQNKL